MANQISGAGYFLKGLSLIIQPGLRRFVLMPLLINMLIFTGLSWLALHYWHELMVWVSAHLPHWLQWVQWVLWVIFALLSIIVIFYTFTTITNLIAAPFNNLLAEKVELYLTGNLPPNAEGRWSAIKSIPSALGRQVGLIRYYLVRAVLLFVLSFVPGIQPITTVAWFVFTAWMAALQYLDYPMDNHKISVQRMREYLGKKRWTGLIFGSSIMLLTMVPIINFFVMPAAVAGATLFWVKEFREKTPVKMAG